MKTPDEIKKGLEFCNEDCFDGKAKCPYAEMNLVDGISCIRWLSKDVLVYVRQIEAERDQAINDLRGRCFSCAYAKPHEKYQNLIVCPHIKTAVGGNGNRYCTHWKWRGVKDVE